MSSIHQHRPELFVAMQLRRFGFGCNPLRRNVDRLESALLVAILGAGLLMIPAAAALGTAGLAVPVLVWPTLFALYRSGVRRLDRHRADDWARQWRQVAPRWTGRQY